MKVFCPHHKTGFFTPRRNPIRCKNSGHVLGEFFFHGDAKASLETLWQYCCNCEHFSPIELGQSALETCPACERRISQRYMCDRCFTVSLESTTRSEAKNFTLTSDGAPQPSCPGCLQEPAADLREHDCEKLGAGFTTPLNTCPICREHLDVGPVFPSSVAQYLRKTKTANKLNVAFDYPTGLFLPVENGEFVLVSNGSENGRPVVLPRSARFASKRDFYELYQDYYHCRNVNAGELNIIEPALVERIGQGWKLRTMGVLEIVDTEPKADAPPNNIPSDTESQGRERSALFSATLIEESPVVVKAESPAADTEKSPPVKCRSCGSLVETDYTFCWNCGQRPKADPAGTKAFHVATPASRHVLVDDDEPTVEREVSDIQPSILSWAVIQPSETSRTSSTVKLVAIGIGLLLLTLGGLLLKGSVSQLSRSADAQQVTSNLQATAGIAPPVEPKAESNAHANPTIDPVEEELRKLRENRIGASDSDRSTVLQLLASTEKQYPNDYRFPYERAKLVINSRETKSHDDAFNALSLAAQDAIKSGKTQQMLDGLEADKFGDFHKLAQGHHEWAQIIEALKRKDVTLLSSN